MPEPIAGRRHIVLPEFGTLGRSSAETPYLPVEGLESVSA
jgi:hypothetical protein